LKYYFIIIISFIINAISCSQHTDIAKGMQIYTVSDEIYNDPSCEIKVFMHNIFIDDNIFNNLFKNCKVLNGKLFLSIPDIIQDQYIIHDEYDSMMYMIKYSVLFIDFKDSNGNGTIFLGKKRDNESYIDHITFIYSDRNADIPIPLLSDGSLKTINFENRWNMIDWVFNENYNNIQTLYNAGYKWYIKYIPYYGE